MIELKNLTRQTDTGTCPDGVSILFRNSRIYGIAGSEESDNSILLALIAGALTPTDGQVLISGYDVHSQPKEAKRRLGYLPGPLPLPTDVTVGEYLSFVAEVKGLRDDLLERRIREILKQTMLLDSREGLVDKLSPASRVALGLAQALVSDPDVLLLDEPTKGLDAQAAQDTYALIRRLAADRTVLITAADAASLGGVCDSILMLQDGRLVGEDTVADQPKEVDA